MRSLSFILVVLFAGCMHPEFESTVSVERLRVQADEHFRDREYALAIERYEELSQAVPLRQMDCYQLGKAYYFTEQFEKADLTFAKLQVKSPHSSVALLWRARSNAAIDSTAEKGAALLYFQKIVDDPNVAPKNKSELREAYLYLCFYYHERRDYEQVKKYLTKLIEISDHTLEIEAYNAILKTLQEKNEK
jgi:tetratricopeptide (TPR) repeat protein